MPEHSRRRFLGLCGASSLSGFASCLGETAGPSDLGEERPERSFDPTVDGFGFTNWGTTSERYPSHDHDTVSQEEISRVIQRDWGSYLTQENWMTLSELPAALRETIVKQLYVSINQGSATDGHCFGMVNAAAEYFQNPDRVPSPDQRPASIEEPIGAVGDTIDFHHNRQILDPQTWGAWMLLHGNYELDYQSHLSLVRRAIDRVGVSGLALVTWPRQDGHTVLAYDYRRRQEELILDVYDPNWPAKAYRTETKEIRFDTSGERPQLVTPYDQRYSRVAYIGRGVSLPTLVRAGADVIARYLLGGVFTVLVTSPVSLRVVDAKNVELRRDTADHMSSQPTEYSNIRYRYGEPSGEYTISVSGTAGTAFSIEIDGASRRGKLIDREITGRFDQNTTTQAYRVTVPEFPSGDPTILPSRFGRSSPP